MPEHSAKSTNDAQPMSLPRRFDIVMGRVGRTSLLISFVAGLIWATASGEDYPLVLVFPLLAILATRLVGGWLGGFVGYVAKYALGWLLAWVAVSLLLFYMRLHELPHEYWGDVLSTSRPQRLDSNITWSLALIVGFLCATAFEFGLALLAVVTLCARRVLRISPASLQLSDPGRWYQLSLKTSLLLVLTFSVGTGWFVTRLKRARANRDRVATVSEAVAAIEELGARVSYSRDDDRRKPTWLEELFDDTGNPDNPIVEVKVRWVSIENLDALDLISELDDLKLLQISKSDLTDAHLRKIGEMTGLESLLLSDLQVEHFGALRSIKSLDLSDIQVEGPGPENLPGLNSLTELTLGETTGFFEHVSEMPSLRTIKLYHEGVDSTLRHLERLPALREVDLRGSDVTGEGLRHLTRLADLEKLWLGATGISDSDLLHVGKMTKLEVLSLAGTKLTDQGMEKLRNLTLLGSLDLSYTGIGDGGVKVLQGHTALGDLNLFSTQVTDSGLAHLEGLDLYSLDLSYTQITNSGLAYLAGMSSLQTLALQGTKIDDAGLKHLMGLVELRELDLYKTSVTDEGEAELRDDLPQLW